MTLTSAGSDVKTPKPRWFKYIYLKKKNKQKNIIDMQYNIYGAMGLE